jgi:hypothetical protein
VLDARKRPSINEVLAMPVLRARIARFLDQTLQVSRQLLDLQTCVRHW